MISFIKLIKDYIIYNFNTLIYAMANIDYDRQQKINNRIDIINNMKVIKKSIKESDLESHLFNNISSFLYGDFIEVRFKNNKTDNFYFFRDDVISSDTLIKLFQESERTGKVVFKLDIEYKKLYFDVMVNYLIYNDNKDNIGTMVYNSNSLMYLKDSDEFNNELFFSLNFFELEGFQKYINYFRIKVLDFKVGAILDIINICMKTTIHGKRTEPLRKII